MSIPAIAAKEITLLYIKFIMKTTLNHLPPTGQSPEAHLGDVTPPRKAIKKVGFAEDPVPQNQDTSPSLRARVSFAEDRTNHNPRTLDDLAFALKDYQ